MPRNKKQPKADNVDTTPAPQQQLGLSPITLIAEQKNVHFSGVALKFDDGATFEEWNHVLQGFAAIDTISGFCIGDALNFGSKKFGTADKDRYTKAVAATGLSKGTLKNYAMTAARFAPDQRRVGLSVEHHRLAAPVKDDTKLTALLDRAENEKLSASAFREIVPKTKRKAKKKTPEEIAAQDRVEDQNASDLLITISERVDKLEPEKMTASDRERWTKSLLAIQISAERYAERAVQAAGKNAEK